MKTHFLILLLVVSCCNCELWSSHYGSSSEYIHSNDTMTLQLSSRSPLYGPPGSQQTLEFILSNRGNAGHFTFKAISEDGFVGTLSTRETYLGPNNMQSVIISNMVVPQRKEGSTVRFTLTVIRDSGFNKREAPGGSVGGSGSYSPGGSGIGGSGSYNPGNPGGSGVGGSGSYNPGYPGGSGVGGSGSYNPGYPGGSGVGGSGSYNPGYPGGSGVGGSGSYGGNENQGGSGIGGSGSYNPDMPFDDPSDRRDISLTVEFRVTNERIEDDEEPWTELAYIAESEEETCSVNPGEPGCDTKLWAVEFLIKDEDSGLHVINVEPISAQEREQGPFANPIYYRYINFPIGSRSEHKVIAVTTCCTPNMRLRVTDVSGNEAIVEAQYDGVGSGGLSKTALYGIIGGVAAFVLIIVIVIVVVVCRKKYSPVSQNP